MMELKQYNIIVPSIDYNGPVTLVLDLGRRAAELGYKVTIYYLNSYLDTSIVNFHADVKKLQLSDIKEMQGIVHSICIKPDFINFVIRLCNKNVFCLTTIPSFLYEDMKYDYNKWVAWITWRVWKLFAGILDRRVVLSKTMLKYYAKVAPRMSCDVVYHSRRQPALVSLNATNKNLIKEQIGSYDNNLVFVAGLRPRKNILRLIQEVYKYPDVSLTIFGDGTQRLEVEDALKRDTKQIIYLGHDPSAHSYLNFFDALILPSFAEGLPGVVLEAIDQRCLCLLSDLDVHRELCDMGVGLIFNHHTFSNFYMKVVEIKSLGGDNEMVKNLGVIKDRHFDHDLNFTVYEKLFRG